MIDEWAERVVDELCARVPPAARLCAIRLSRWGVMWHVWLALHSVWQGIARAVGRIKSEDEVELLLRETEERSDDTLAKLQAVLQRQRARLARLDDAGIGLTFTAMLFLTALAALGVLAVGGREMALAALAALMLWLSAAMDAGYAPLCGALRQRYLAAMLLRGGAFLALLWAYFARYVRDGLPTNVVLQSAMLVTLFMHAALFLVLVALNRHQPLLLRALSGVLGVIPALTAAAALALAAASVGAGMGQAAAGVLRACGALMAFAGDQLIEVTALGAIRLRYNAIWIGLFMCAGMLLMLVAAWLGA